MKKTFTITILLLFVVAQFIAVVSGVQALPEDASLWITRLTPTGPAGHPFDSLELTFSADVAESSVGMDDVTMSGSGGAIPVQGITRLAADRYQLNFTGLTDLGAYHLTVGPNILDLASQPLDQNHNQVGGEPGDAYQVDLFSTAQSIQPDNLAFDGSNLVFFGSSSVIDGVHNFASLEVLGGAELSHTSASLVEEYRFDLNLVDGLWIDAASKINVNGKGYLPGRTIGNTAVGKSTGLAGGSYGGLGAFRSGIPNKTYGDYHNPNEMGSGSGDDPIYSSFGSSGGGLVRITAATAQVDGAISANGSGPVSDLSSGPAGGSGGGIYLQVGLLSGNGYLHADGGKNGWGSQEGGAGGGGRVAVYYDSLSGFDLSHISANSGTVSIYSPAAVGTVFTQQSGSRGVLRIDSQGAPIPAGAYTPLGLSSETVFAAEDVIISGSGVVAAPEHQMPLQFANLTLSDNATLTHLAASDSQVFSLQLTVSDTLSIAASAKIDVSAKGYLPGYTTGNTTAGAATGTSGGSHGGYGGPPAGAGIPNRTYGDATAPWEAGAGSGNSNIYGTTGNPGGGVVFITAQQVVLDGQIQANGGSAYNPNPGPGAGAGGSILINTGDLSGSGTIAANGGDGGWSSVEGGCGGGGRVAIYYRSSNSLPEGNVTANKGLWGAGACSPGSVTNRNQAAFRIHSPRGNLLHGAQTLGWVALGMANLTTDIEVFHAGNLEAVLGSQLPPDGQLSWDTTSLADGIYEIRTTFRNADQSEAGRASKLVLVNNTAIWHSGDLLSNQTWGAGPVHIIAADFAVNPGVTLTIQPGTVVKAAPWIEFFVQPGGVLNAAGSTANPVIFTSLADDSAGGDTNLDGSLGQPRPGDWFGITTQGDGQANLNSDVDLRYLYRRHSGVLTGDETWKGTDLHLITGDVSVPAGTTLSIQPGAVIKFAANTMLSVAQQATLTALGLASQPIYFTSDKDDSLGGDSNEDNDATTPNPGDWVTLRISGAATLDHIVLRDAGGSNAGGYQSFSGLITAETGSTVTLSNSLLQDGLYDGIIYRAPVNVSNTIVINTQRALFADTSGSGVFNNVVIDRANSGMHCHGGTAQVNNSVIYRSVVNGVYGDCATLRYSNVWSETGQNYSITDQTGLRGNISLNPGFAAADTGNYRPTFASPLIDAADGPLAPSGDWMGAPRYDDPRSTNTGLANPDGSFADMGAYEFAENAPSDLDLVVTAIDGPQVARAGSISQLTYTVVNQGSAAIYGPWRDELGLLGPTDLTGEIVQVGSGLVLGPGQSHTFEVQVRVPGGVEDAYRWQVKANARGDFFEGQNRGNNTSLSTALVNLQVPELIPGGPVQSGIFASVGQPHWFKLNTAAGQDVELSLDHSDNSASSEMYVLRGAIPTPENFDFSQDPGTADLRQIFHSPVSATYYILIRSGSLPGGAQGFTLRARSLGFELVSSSPNLVGNTGSVVITLRGSGFTPDAAYEVVSPSAVAYGADWVSLIDSSEVQAQFDFSNLPLGAYTLRVRDGGNTTTLSGALTVETGTPPVILVSASYPKRVRRYAMPSIIFNYTNSSNIDLPPALLNIKIDNYLPGIQAFGAQLTRYQGLTDTDQVYAIMLPALGPRQSGQFVVSVAANTTGEFPLSVQGISLGMDGSQFARPYDRYATVSPHLIEVTGDTYLHASVTVQTQSGSGDLDFQLHKETTETPILPMISMSQNGGIIQWTHEMTTEALNSSPSGKPLTGSGLLGLLSKLWDAISGTQQVYDGVNKVYDYKNAIDLQISRSQVNDCLLNGGYVDQNEYDELNRYNEGVLALKLITDSLGELEGADAFGSHLELMNIAMEPGWELALKKNYEAKWVFGGPWDNIKMRYDPKNAQELALAVIQECFPNIKDKTSGTMVVLESEDPNEISGPMGYGSGHYVDNAALLNYTIEFENQPSATLPAQEVVITNRLDPAKFDLSTFQLGPVWVGGRMISVPPGKEAYTAELDLRPENDLILNMQASLDHSTGIITWHFTSLDPLTREITSDSLAGFLPPNFHAPEGQGGVSYSVYPLMGQVSGTILESQASITFDLNPLIETAVWLNTLDDNIPSSSVQPLPQESGTSFSVSWLGQDGLNGAGVDSYDVYVSDNGGEFLPWKIGISQTSARFSGVAGHTYAFYCVATDGVGHRQPQPSIAQASTLVKDRVYLPIMTR